MSKLLCFRLPLAGLAALILFAGLLARPAFAAEDAVHFGSAIHVDADQTIQDAVCFFCSVDVKGTVDGNIVSFFGNVKIEGHASHDVVNFFGGVKAADGTSIGDDVVNFFGSVRLGENVSVGKDVVVMFGSLHAPDSVTIGGDRVVQSEWVFWGPFLLIFGGIWFLVREFGGQRRRRMLRGY